MSDQLTAWAIILCFVALYMLPGIVAANRRHHNAGAIVVLNVFLGWSMIGWILALVWASTEVRRMA